MIKNTYEFYQLMCTDRMLELAQEGQNENAVLLSMDLKEYHLAHTASLGEHDTAETVLYRLRFDPPADFIGDCDVSASLLFLNRDGVRSVFLITGDEFQDMTELVERLLSLQKLALYDGIPGMWALTDTLYAGAEPLEVRESMEFPDLRIHLLANAEGEVVYRIKERCFDQELAAAFKAYAIAHGVSEREVTRVSVGSAGTVVSPDGGLWKCKGMIHTFKGTVYIMEHALCAEYFVFADKNCNLLAAFSEIGIKDDVLMEFSDMVSDMDIPKEERKKKAQTVPDSFENLDVEWDYEPDEEWFTHIPDEELVLPEKKRPVWLRLWDWLCSHLHKKSACPLEENTEDDADGAEPVKEDSVPDE